MTDLLWVPYTAGYLLFAVVFLLAAKKLFDLVTPYSVNVQLTEKDNPAMGLLLAGFLLGVAAVICGVFAGETADAPSVDLFLDEIVEVAIYGAIGTVFLFLAGIVNDKAILYKFSNRNEVIERRNSAVAAVVAATYLGSGLIVAGGIQGSADILTALGAFVGGQVALVLFGLIYQAATRYDDQKELGEKKNLAAGIAFAGNLVAYSLILMKGASMQPGAVDGVDEWSIADRAQHFGYYAVVGVVLLMLVRVANDRLFLPKSKLSKEIAEDRNLAAGLMAAGLAVAMGAALVFCL